MPARIKTVKNQVTIVMVAFSLIVSTLVLTFSLYLMYIFQRRITVQSAEFNLQLVASVIEQDLRDLTALAKWCGVSGDITDYFMSADSDKRLAMRAYNQINEMFMNNRAGGYLQRIIVVDNDRQKILQVGNLATSSQPVTVYTVGKIDETGLGISSEWEAIVSDPFYFSGELKVLPLTCPVYRPRVNNSALGMVFLAASTSVITDKLKGYSLAEGSLLYISLGERDYIIDGDTFVPADLKHEIISLNTSDPLSKRTVAAVIRDGGGNRRTAVSYPVREGVTLTQVLPQENIWPDGGAWGGLLAGLILLVAALALFVIFSMDRTISRPVAKLRRKIDAIAKGDFSPDPGLELDNELGLVGRGVNNLTRDVVALMEKRIADENEKRELEYRMLQSQINPHFLYNTLNSIKWMATIQGADGISEMTTALSRLLKSIAKDIRKVAPLGEELSLLDEYLTIQKYRYGDSVKTTVEVEDPLLLEMPIPRFTLQPIVENSIFHGIEPKGSGNIVIKVARDCGDVLVSITDDGVGIEPKVLSQIYKDSKCSDGMFSKLGLSNVDERLRFAFGQEYGLSAKSEPGKYTEMRFRLPLGKN